MFALFCCLVVANSSRRRRQLVNSLPLGGTFALRHNPYLQSVKSGGSLARNASFWRRRRVVVASSSPTRSFAAIGRYIRTATQSLPSKCEKWRKSRTKCSFWRCQITKWEVVFVFCVTGAILWQCVNASALFFRGRRSTL